MDYEKAFKSLATLVDCSVNYSQYSEEQLGEYKWLAYRYKQLLLSERPTLSEIGEFLRLVPMSLYLPMPFSFQENLYVLKELFGTPERYKDFIGLYKSLTDVPFMADCLAVYQEDCFARTGEVSPELDYVYGLYNSRQGATYVVTLPDETKDLF